MLIERLGDVDPERGAAIVRAGREPLRELLGAMHSKMLLEALLRTNVDTGWVGQRDEPPAAGSIPLCSQ